MKREGRFPREAIPGRAGELNVNPSSPGLVIGTGALACLFAARLAASGAPVMMLGSWAEGLNAIRRRGVRMVDAAGTEKAYPVHATDDPAECAGTAFALVLVKSWQTARVAGQLAECLEEDGVALTLQNGLGNYETLAAALGEERVAFGVTTLGASLIQPGLVRLAGEGSIMLGEHSRIAGPADLLRRAGFEVERVPDPKSLLWGKLVINAAINPVTALLNVPNGELLKDPAAHALLQAAAREAAAVATASGVRLPYRDAVVAVESVAQRTAANYSSMLRDVQRGSPTEIDAISGAIVRAGENAGIATPVNRTLWQLVKALEESSGRRVPAAAKRRSLQRTSDHAQLLRGQRLLSAKKKSKGIRFR
jgi:2-dehydropantoate 2-reductase